MGDDVLPDPIYTLEYRTVERYNSGGKYKVPDIYDVIENEKINILNSDKYEWLSEVPLRFYQAKFEEDYFIPVGQQVVLLNNNTMLVGIWGKIILAHRVKP